ncbi:EAL domain-containing protein [Shewanella sp. NIFS-20-20]|uniref:EAL domain-containing protein n=1 Tax=Shewanella sp. NIFS-20-20 TaxID=2853806 RepID=UPI001C44D8DF|nr:GGDEF domain-containing protein [Shewanella sp. NIFS-20-20]MBV7317444.1 GGDEF domain-containing protein [Shewanella sp. NIFS-20-20]
MTKAYQLLLFLTFAFAFAVEVWQQQSLLAQATKRHQTELIQTLDQFKQYQGDGDLLFQQINAILPLRFFQYITNLDPQQNYTFGQLHPNTNWLENLLPAQVTDDRQLPQARLQLSVDLSPWYTEAAQQLQNLGVQLAIMYLFLSISLMLFTRRLTSSIRYSANYISQLISAQFPPLQASKIRGECQPLASALEQLKQDIKTYTNDIAIKHEIISQKALQDSITGFGNRQCFTQTLSQLGGASQLGTLALIKATELGSINQLHGRHAGDEYLIKISQDIREMLTHYTQAQCFRISSADFAIFIPNLMVKDAAKQFSGLKTGFDEYQRILSTDCIAYIGLVPFTEQSNPATLLAMADSAVSIAQTLGPNQIYVLEKHDESELQGNTRWHQAIDTLLQQRKIDFCQQSIQPCRSNVDMYRELLARFYNSSGQVLPTTTVFAMAERHGKHIEMDKLIVQLVIERLLKDQQLQGWYGVNISSHSALQPDFVAWLKDTLNRYRQVACRLVIEVSEIGIQKNLSASAAFVKAVHSTGARVAIERFGTGFTSFKFFQELRPDFVKLDGSFTNQVHMDSGNRFFIKMIVDIAKRLGVKIIATGVEVQDEKFTLEQLLVDGLQGYYIAKPLTLHPLNLEKQTQVAK